MTLPHHTGQDDEIPVQKAPTRGTKRTIAFAVALLVIVITLHLTGVITGGH